MTSFSVWTERLRASGADWRARSEAVGEARASLVAAEGSASTLGSRVAPAALAFFDAWVGELSSAGVDAERHADALETAALGYDRSDEAQHARLAGLLPWAQRSDLPQAGPSTDEPR